VKQLDFLLTGLHQRLDLTGLTEWTLEMNPATVSLEKARMLRNYDVNRVSMGVQSWDPAMLARLGRIHSAQQAEHSYQILRGAGFTNLNLDLIFGIPGQTLACWEQSLLKTVGLDPEHISAYCLTYEEDTEFFRRFQRGELKQDTEQDAKFYELAMSVLSNTGYEQYEISNYSRPGRECLHNLAYWRGYDYLGLGPSAFSTVGKNRWQNTPDTSRYIQQLQAGREPVAFKEHVTSQIRTAEAIAFGLRMSSGVPVSTMGLWAGEVDALQREGYVETGNARVRLTAKGRMVADSIAELFV
jgi:oxygen-independent coproporphyrinogen-3 oxidase